eukprot:jgi/Mesen1/4567/ME000232S03824
MTSALVVQPAIASTIRSSALGRHDTSLVGSSKVLCPQRLQPIKCLKQQRKGETRPAANGNNSKLSTGFGLRMLLDSITDNAVAYSTRCKSSVDGAGVRHEAEEANAAELNSRAQPGAGEGRADLLSRLGEEWADSQLEDDSESAEEDQDEGSDEEDEEDEEEGEDVEERRVGPAKERRFPLLGNKEKKELRALAHQMGNKLVVQQVGKWGVTPSLVQAMGEALEAHELLKIKVLDNAPGSASEVGRKLETEMEAQVVGRVGSTLLLYRPSLTKLAALKAAKQKSLRSRAPYDFMKAKSRPARIEGVG